MAYDAVRQRVVLFGGKNATTTFGDTWEWDGVDWIPLFPPTGPTPRSCPLMAWDSSRGRIVLHGGRRSVSNLFERDTWEWDGTNWLNVTPSTSPLNPARLAAVMAFDSIRGRLVLVPANTTETWERTNTTWAQIFGAGAAAPSLNFSAMAFSTLGRICVLFGGRDSTLQNRLGDTWEWDGANWTQVLASPAPAPRSDHAMAYDSARNVVVLFGGAASNSVSLNDTWEYSTAAASSFAPFGTACSGGGIPPVLTATTPAIGTTQVIALINLPAAPELAVMWFGVSNTIWGSTPLPWSLAPFGLPPCSLLVSPDIALAAPITLGVASWLVPIANDSQLLGINYYTQGWVADPGSAFGVAISNAGVSTVGL